MLDRACLSASLEDKGLFSSANILQIADAVRRVVVFSQQYAYSFLLQRVKCSAI